MSSRKKRNQTTGRATTSRPTSPAAVTPAFPSTPAPAEADDVALTDTPLTAAEAEAEAEAEADTGSVTASASASASASETETDALDVPDESAGNGTSSEAGTSERSPRLPSWSMAAETDVWSATDPSDETDLSHETVPSDKIDPSDETVPSDKTDPSDETVPSDETELQDEPLEAPAGDAPATPEAAWLQDGADDIDAQVATVTEADTAEREQSGDPALAPDREQPGAPDPQPGDESGLFDPESGNRWTVVDESAGSAERDGDEPGEQSAQYGGDSADADAGDASDSDANAGAAPDAPDALDASDPNSAPSGSASDALPAFPVPVTMSPKAKKFGWSRESLLTGQPAPSAGDAPDSRSPRTEKATTEKAKNLWRSVRGAKAGSPTAERTGSADVEEHDRTTDSAHSAGLASPDASGTSANSAPPTGTLSSPPGTPSSKSSSPSTGSAASTGYAGSTAAATSTATSTATTGTTGTTGTPGVTSTSGTADASSSQSTPEDDAPTGRFHHVLQVLSPYLRTHRAALLTGAIALLLSVWLLVALPFPLKYAVDAAVASTGADLPALAELTGDPGRRLAIGVIVFSALLVLQVATRFTAVAALGRVGVRTATSLRSSLLSHLHRLTPGAEGRPSSGSSAARQGEADQDDVVRPLIEDVAALRDLLSHSGPRAAASILTLLTLLVVTVIVAPLGALVLLATGLLYTLAIGLSMRRSRSAAATARSESRMLADTADELVAATGTVQTYGLETRSSRGLTEAGLRAGRALTRSRRVDSLQNLLTQLVAGIGVVGTLLLCGSRVAADAMTPGDLVLVLVDVLILLIVLRDLLENVGSLRGAAAAGDRIADLLEREASIAEPQRTQPVDRVGGEIVFSAVNTAVSTPVPTAADTAAGSGGNLFDMVSLVVPSGQHVALLDREGRESAALIAYLLRFDQPDTGRVLLDRYDTRAVSLGDLRRQLAVVQREPVLFTDTVRENIRIGRPDATDDEVRDAARRAGIDDVISQLSNGFDTVLVRRGDVLTDGQRRRVAIARALLRDAPIVVLDAADAGLSGAERRPVLAALAALAEGRTAIVRSRDPETVTAMDRVLWFEGGEVREDGTPAVLASDPDSRLTTWLRAQDETVS
ncbi:ABC transporter transmembrane domain-containing protein [Brachybacterium sp. AOP3-A1-3]|uniref:ABC transporter transmembrane domain-containing protein n=1 Tax=Brachybacterium sp. AOP3-A1-3 TaxID=3457699 RepID=UPI0040338D16